MIRSAILNRVAHVAVFTSLFSVLLGPQAFAQGNGPGQRDPAKAFEAQMAQLKERLKLTKDQEPKVREILKAQNEKRRAIFEKTRARETPDRQGMREEMQKLQQETDKQLGRILTKDQMEAYKKFQDEMRQRGPGGRGGFRGSHEDR